MIIKGVFDASAVQAESDIYLGKGIAIVTSVADGINVEFTESVSQEKLQVMRRLLRRYREAFPTVDFPGKYPLSTLLSGLKSLGVDEDGLPYCSATPTREGVRISFTVGDDELPDNFTQSLQIFMDGLGKDPVLSQAELNFNAAADAVNLFSGEDIDSLNAADFRKLVTASLKLSLPMVDVAGIVLSIPKSSGVTTGEIS